MGHQFCPCLLAWCGCLGLAKRAAAHALWRLSLTHTPSHIFPCPCRCHCCCYRRIRVAAEAANLPIEKFTIRLDSRTQLLYASTTIQRGGAADLANSGPEISAASDPGPLGANQGLMPQPRDDSSSSSSSEDGVVTPQINTNWWPVIRSTQTFPRRAIGWVEMYRGTSRWGYCSGSLYGPRMIVTAGALCEPEGSDWG